MTTASSGGASDVPTVVPDPVSWLIAVVGGGAVASVVEVSSLDSAGPQAAARRATATGRAPSRRIRRMIKEFLIGTNILRIRIDWQGDPRPMNTTRRQPAPNVLYDVWRVSRRVGTLLDTALEPVGIGASDFGLYSLLAMEGPLTPSELARRSAAPASTISQALNRLEGRGHVERRPNAHDARSTMVGLTAAGRELHRRASAPFVTTLSSLEDELGEDGDRVRAGLYRLEVALAALTGEEPPPPPQLGTPPGPPPDLTTQQQREVDAFAAWLRWRGSGLLQNV
jgi:DNA-binding MarR family transcriptional regulator